MLDFNSGLLRLKKQGGLESIVGWTVHAPRVEVGRVVEVIKPAAGNRRIKQTLLRTEKATDLTPSYKGTESHLVPLVEAYVEAFDEEKNMVLTRLPKGFLDLGRRQLILDHLGQELALLSIEKAMPSRAELIDMGRSDLLPLIAKAGGFSSTAAEIGLKWRGKKQNGYWEDPSNLDKEIEQLINSSWLDMGGYFINSMTQSSAKKPTPERGAKRFMPTISALKSAGRWDLYQQIARFGGVKAVGEMLGRKSVTKAGRQAIVATRDELMHEIQTFIQTREEQGRQEEGCRSSDKVRLPTESELHQAGRSEIAHGIQRLVGGFARLAEESGMTTARRPRSYWRNTENVVNEVTAFVADRDRSMQDSEGMVEDLDDVPLPKFPTQIELKAAGRDDLIYAIRLHGHQKLCQQCKMRGEMRGLKKGFLLKFDMVSSILDKASAPLSLIQIQEILGREGVTVSRQHLSNFLARSTREGRLAKVSRGKFSPIPSALQ
jgi:hypothetical protein